MADTTILSGDVGVTWFDNNRQKRLTWEGTTGFYTMNQLYSAMQTLQDETTTIDDGTCFSAETPTEYTIGIIDQGDNDPWYITYELMEHIQGGALKTASWTRVTSSNTGIIAVPVDPGGSIVKDDEGFDISGATDGNGTLLEYIDTGGTWDFLLIRPDSSAAGDDFTTVDQVITSARGAFTAVQWDTASSTTGDQIWPNIYSIGTVEAFVHMYVYQGQALTTDARSRVYSWNDATKDWYGNGNIDICVAIKDMADTGGTWSVIDGGYLTVYARRAGSLYASFEVENSIVSGGRNPVPLQTSANGDMSHGTQKISTGAWTGTYTDKEIITDGTTGGRGIIDLANSTTNSEIVYFPITEDDIGGTIVALGNGNTITGASSGATSTSSSVPSNDGAADSTWFTAGVSPTIAFTATSADIDNDTVNEYYGIPVDCNANPLQEVFDWLMYIGQYGQGTGGVVDTAESGIYGEEYIGGTAYITYTGGATPDSIAEGESVTQVTSGATGVVLSHNTVDDIVLLRSTRGTFDSNQINRDDDSGTSNWTGVTSENFAPNTSNPFGTLPGGGTFFGARGVLLTDYLAADENNFVLQDIQGGSFARPASISFTVTNLVGGAQTSNEHDRVSIFRLTGAGGNVDKTEYDVTGAPAAGEGTLAVGATIADDLPAAGTLVVLQDPGLATAVEYYIRYTSYTAATFTLANVASTATAGTGDTTLVDSGASFLTTAKRGDLVWSSVHSAHAYVLTVDSNTQLTLQGLGIVGLVTTNAYELNAVPVALDTGDDVYVPIMRRIAESSEESVSIIYVAPIFYRVKVRNTRNTTTKIKPYSSDGSTSGTNQSTQVTRTPDTIIT